MEFVRVLNLFVWWFFLLNFFLIFFFCCLCSFFGVIIFFEWIFFNSCKFLCVVKFFECVFLFMCVLNRFRRLFLDVDCDFCLIVLLEYVGEDKLIFFVKLEEFIWFFIIFYLEWGLLKILELEGRWCGLFVVWLVIFLFL